MRGVFAIVVSVGACSYQPTRGAASDPDASTDEVDAPSVTPDAFVGPPPTPCVEAWLAGTVQLANPSIVDGSSLFTTAEERDPFVSSDGRVLYFVRENGGDNEIHFARRQQASGPFNNVTVKQSLSDDQVDDGKVTITGDDLQAFQSTRRGGGTGGGFDFWHTSRTSGFDQAFGAMSQNLLGTLNDAGDQQDPHISPDGLRLYFAAGMPQQLVASGRLNALQPFPAATPLANLADRSGDADPTLSGDERVIVFTSNRGGGLGLTDLWYATRAERDLPFGTPVNVSVNTTFQEGDPHLSPDGCTLYFASTREGSGDYDLYVTTEANLVP